MRGIALRPLCGIRIVSMATERLRRVLSRSGQPTVEVDGVAYHSVHDPLREVRRFYSALKLEDADVILHFGWGLGYCGETLRERTKPGARIVVFEPDEELFELSRAESVNSDVFEEDRFEFVVGANVSHFFDDWETVNFRETDQILWVEWPAALREYAQVAESLQARFKSHLRDRAANLLTHFQNGEVYFEHVIGNFEYQGDADAGRLFGRFRNIPLVLVSAGPSLDRNIGQLRDRQDRCFILSVDTALRPLLAAGITPHAVITEDPSELNAQHVVGAIPESVYLIAEQAVHRSALDAATRRFVFGLGLFPDSLFSKFGFGKSSLDAWGSVATTALDLACRMGANPIVFAGQDFAYSWYRDYASNTIYHGNPFYPERSGTEQADDIFGNTAHTTENMIAYRDYFVRRMKQESGVRFINATEGGILTEGAEVLPLWVAFEQILFDPVDIAGVLAESHQPSKASADALEHLHQVLKYRRTDCACLDGFLELAAKEHLLSRDESEVEKTILRGIDTISAR